MLSATPRFPEEDSRTDPGEDSVSLGRFHHLGCGFELDRAGEVEALALEEQRLPEHRLKIHVELLLVETRGVEMIGTFASVSKAARSAAGPYWRTC
jgi:hypothetical protein